MHSYKIREMLLTYNINQNMFSFPLSYITKNSDLLVIFNTLHFIPLIFKCKNKNLRLIRRHAHINIYKAVIICTTGLLCLISWYNFIFISYSQNSSKLLIIPFEKFRLKNLEIIFHL